MVDNKINTIFDDYVKTSDDRQQTSVVREWVKYK